MNVSNWPGEYLEQAIADEIALAAVHAQKHLRGRVRMPTFLMHDMKLMPEAARTKVVMPLPAWRRSWSAAGPLIALAGLEIRQDHDESTVTVCANGRRRGHTEHYADHPGQDEAVVAAIVRAATQVFIEAREAA